MRGRYDDQTLSVQGSTATRTRRPQAEAKPNRLRVRLLVVAGVAVVLVLGVGLAFAGNANRLPEGVTIAGVDVGGMSPNAARALLAGRPTGRASAGHIRRGLAVVGDKAGRPRRPRGLGRAVDEAMAKGGGTSFVRGFRRIGLRFFPTDVEPRSRVQQRRRVQGQPARGGRRPAPTATRGSCGTGSRSQLVGGAAGHKLDREPPSTSLSPSARRLAREHVQLPVEADPPKVTVARAPAGARPRGARRVGAGHAEDRHRQLRRPAAAARGDADASDAEARRTSRSAALPRDAYFGKLDATSSHLPKDAGFVVGSDGEISVSPAEEGLALDVREDGGAHARRRAARGAAHRAGSPSATA